MLYDLCFSIDNNMTDDVFDSDCVHCQILHPCLWLQVLLLQTVYFQRTNNNDFSFSWIKFWDIQTDKIAYY